FQVRGKHYQRTDCNDGNDPADDGKGHTLFVFGALYLAAKKYLGVRAGFIHVPFENGQVVDKANGTPFMSLEMIAKGLEYGIEAAVTTTDDVQKAMGETH
ncbi:MAG TPA: hypothetical protein K8W23_08405, partial [Sellimonas intestinalis]|nr:hypothetical protein [Sellimonas intestinalis]